MGRLLPLPFAVLLACSIESSGLATGPTADGGDDAGDLDATVDGETGIDAGPPAIVGPDTLGPSGSRNAHPAVVWTGDVFVVAHFADDGAGGRNVLVSAARPGAELAARPALTMTAGVARSSLSLAHSDAGTAIGWVEGGGASGELHVRVLPDSPRGTFANVEVHEDFDDAHLMWDRGELVAVLRQRSGSQEALTAVAFTPGPGMVAGVAGPVEDFGEIATASSSAGSLVVSSEARTLYIRRDDLFWREAYRLSFSGSPMEGDVVELADGALLGVFAVNDGTGRTLRGQRLAPSGDGTWTADGPEVLYGWNGPDVVLTMLGADRVLLAWVDETSSPPPRPLALAVLDAAGIPGGDPPCAIELELAYANDPDVACGGGWCAVVWMEADDLLSEAYITRFIQLPITSGSTLACPTQP